MNIIIVIVAREIDSISRSESNLNIVIISVEGNLLTVSFSVSILYELDCIFPVETNEQTTYIVLTVKKCFSDIFFIHFWFKYEKLTL